MVNSNLAYSYESADPSRDNIIENSPIKWCPVSLSDVIKNGSRLEATVFDVEAEQARNIVENCKYPVIKLAGNSGLVSAYVCGRFKRIWVNKSDYPIYQPSTIVDIKPTPDGYISNKTKTNIERLRVSVGQILMTCSGTIGKVSFVSRTLDGMIFSHDLLRINCNNPEDAGYVYTFLKSSIGNRILLSKRYGIIKHIEPEHLQNIPIPNPPGSIKHHLNKLITSSYELRDESNLLIDKATNLMYKELSVSDVDAFRPISQSNSSVNSFNVKLSELSKRLDASYHIPIADEITKHLHRNTSEVTTVGDSRISKEVILPGRFKRVYVDEGVGRVFIGGKQIHELDPSNKKFLSNVHHGSRIASQLELHENMTLITCSGTVGKVALVGKHWENWTANQHIIRIIPATTDIAGYLYIFLASELAFPLITRFTYGSVVDEIDDTHVSLIPFPILNNKEIQKQINDLSLEANRKRYEAFQLEQEAIRFLYEHIFYAK